MFQHKKKQQESRTLTKKDGNTVVVWAEAAENAFEADTEGRLLAKWKGSFKWHRPPHQGEPGEYVKDEQGEECIFDTPQEALDAAFKLASDRFDEFES